MNSDAIIEELFDKMDDLFPHYVPMRFYISTGMANYNCHSIAHAVGRCLDDSRIITAKAKGREYQGEPLPHSWVERDGHVIDATLKLITPKEVFYKDIDVTEKESRTVQEYLEKRFRFCDSTVTRQQIEESPKRKRQLINTFTTFLFQKTDALNSSGEIKQRLHDKLTLLGNRDIIEHVSKRVNSEVFDDAFLEHCKKQHPNSYLFDDSKQEITDRDAACFHVQTSGR